MRCIILYVKLAAIIMLEAVLFGGFKITILLEIDVSYQGSLILYYNYLTVFYFKQTKVG